MGKITVETCEIEGLKIITPQVFGDSRGYFMETYNYNDYKEAGIDQIFVQDNQSASAKNVLRGLHFQINFPQDKLVRVVSGEVFDVAVDLRPGSATFGKWHGVILSAENKKQFFIPKNFAHGFFVLSDYAEFAYKCTDFYHPNDEGGLKFDDPDIGVAWPFEKGTELIMSERIQNGRGSGPIKKSGIYHDEEKAEESGHKESMAAKETGGHRNLLHGLSSGGDPGGYTSESAGTVPGDGKAEKNMCLCAACYGVHYLWNIL